MAPKDIIVVDTETKSSGHILVVDDQAQWRSILKIHSEKAGFQVLSASTVTEAENLLQTYNFDVAILDIRLEDKDSFNIQGVGLYHLITTKYPLTKIIAFTGYPDHIPDVLAFDAVFLKSGQGFNGEQFRQTIQNLVQQSQVNRKL